MAYAHEYIIIRNRGLRDEEVVWAEGDMIFSTAQAAQASADQLNADFDLGLEIYPFVEEDF